MGQTEDEKMAKQTAEYSTPEITGQRDLRAHMMADMRSMVSESDAEIKHGVQPTQGYQAPEITEQRDLDGRLQNQSDVS